MRLLRFIFRPVKFIGALAARVVMRTTRAFLYLFGIVSLPDTFTIRTVKATHKLQRPYILCIEYPSLFYTESCQTLESAISKYFDQSKYANKVYLIDLNNAPVMEFSRDFPELNERIFANYEAR